MTEDKKESRLEHKEGNTPMEPAPTTARLMDFVCDLIKKKGLEHYKPSSRLYRLLKSYEIKYLPSDVEKELPNLDKSLNENKQNGRNKKKENTITVLESLKDIQREDLVSTHEKKNTKGLRDAYT